MYLTTTQGRIMNESRTENILIRVTPLEKQLINVTKILTGAHSVSHLLRYSAWEFGRQVMVEHNETALSKDAA